MTASHTAPTSTRSSIFSKLTGPFASKQTLQIKQDIELDEPFKYFAPGDSVKGAVHLEVAKPIRATHLVIRLHGFVKVVIHSKLPKEFIPYDENLLNSAKGRRGVEYFGNGFAKLFEDEHVLCGDGRLAGKYVFRFELLLPRHGTPSSIDFENGTITYLLTSTLTRPTTISPTNSKNLKLKVKEDIDIAAIPKPRPQTVSLETINRRRPVMHLKRKISGTTNGKAAAGDFQEEFTETPRTIHTSAMDGPCSPVLSQMSSMSRASSGTSNTQCNTGASISHEGKSVMSSAMSLTSSDKTITAQTEVLQGGCLPGDQITIRVSVDHTKPIKSMQGVIVTLYRLARIDTHPDIPLGPSNGRTKAKYEDLYPKSRTGLGGLSFSSAGSSRTFRQDLDQNIAPLIVDPHSLTAVLKTSVRVPDHTFPSISGVPGSMISFKHFVEIVIDLSGKLGQDRLLSRFSMTDTPQHAYEDPKINMIGDEGGITFSTTPGFSFLITDQIRRQKGVVYTKSEVILGTRDSTRSRGKQREDNNAIETDRHRRRSRNLDLPNGESATAIRSSNLRHSGEVPQRFRDHESDQVQPLPYIPLSQASTEPLDEKARIRQAEQTLLPSEPPPDSSSSGMPELIPSAPFAHDEEDFVQRYHVEQPAPSYEAQFPNSGPQDPTIGFSPVADSNNDMPRPDVAVSVSAANGSSLTITDDKQEFERRRLLAQARAPPHTGGEQSGDHHALQPQASSQFSPNAQALDRENTSPMATPPFLAEADARRVDQQAYASKDVSKPTPIVNGLRLRRRESDDGASPALSRDNNIPEHQNVVGIEDIGPRTPTTSTTFGDRHDPDQHHEDADTLHHEDLPAYRR